MIPVSNSGPLIALARIDHLNLLPELFGGVLLPDAVYREVTMGSHLPGAQLLANADWVARQTIKTPTEVEKLQDRLDAGESEAIVLAEEKNVLLLIDERRARTVALMRGISITGTVGILIAAKQKDLIPVIRSRLDSLKSAQIRISDRLYHTALRLTGE